MTETIRRTRQTASQARHEARPSRRRIDRGGLLWTLLSVLLAVAAEIVGNIGAVAEVLRGLGVSSSVVAAVALLLPLVYAGVTKTLNSGDES